MITLKLKYQNNIFENIKDIQKVYSSCVKFCYNRFKKNNLNQKQIRNLIKDKKLFPLIDTWFIQSAIYDANSIFKANKDKKVIFGGKYNQKQYIKNKISKETYNNKRLLPISSIGETLKTANRKFNLDIINNNQIIFKPKNNLKINIQLPKLRKNFKNTLYYLEELQNNKQISISYKLDKQFIYITFDECLITKNNYIGKDNRILGIDSNPNYIGLSILEFNKNNEFKIIYKETIDFSKLNIKSGEKSSHPKSKYLKNKHKFEIIEVNKYIIDLAKRYKVSKICIEELNIKSKDTKKGKNFNRLVNNNWNRNLQVNNLRKRCNLNKIELIEINAAYSSFIGNIQYGSENNCPDMVASSIEIGRRGYRKFEKGWFYPAKKNNDNLEHLWKENLDWSSMDWKQIYSFCNKKSELKYRFPLKIDDNNSFMKVFRLKSYKSNINLYKFI